MQSFLRDSEVKHTKLMDEKEGEYLQGPTQPGSQQSAHGIHYNDFREITKDENGVKLKLLTKLSDGEDIITGLKSLDPSLVHDQSKSCCFYCNTSIQEGQIGLATRFGKTFFLPPGNYWYRGIGVDYVKTLEVGGNEQYDSPEQYVRARLNVNPAKVEFADWWRWMDVTYVNVSEAEVAIVQQGEKEMLLGPGRYLMRDPFMVYAKINIKTLTQVETVNVITEEPGKVVQSRQALGGRQTRETIQKTIAITAGRYQTAGAITFVRAQPGFLYIIQEFDGSLRHGQGQYVARGPEKFHSFFDTQQYARTTRPFQLQSSDRQEVVATLQLKWRLVHPQRWLTVKGASEDVFDAIEEITESLMRDAVAGLSYEDCQSQRGAGYATVEEKVFSKLEEETEALGGELLGMEIRSLRFPLLEERNAEHARAETIAKENVLEETNMLKIKEEARKSEMATLTYNQGQEIKDLQHEGKLQELRDTEDMAKLRAQANLELSKQNLNMEKKLQLLQGEVKQQLAEFRQAEKKAEIAARSIVIAATGRADERIEEATVEASTVESKAMAEAEAKLALAQADAKAAGLIGSAYKDNTAFMRLQTARLHAEVLEDRSNALAVASMLPPNLQEELSNYTGAEHDSA